MTIKRSYTLEKSPPPPMSWTRYAAVVRREYSTLLESKPTEKQMQAFLEMHPSLLPGPHGVPISSGHGPMLAAVVSQPSLPTYGGEIPDFMWLATDSVTFSPVLIEIEAPNKPWFTKSEQPSHSLTQARDQLESWRAWFSSPTHIHLFYEHFQIPDYLRVRLFKPFFVLIYGRRGDANRTADTLMKRALMQTETVSVVSFDRLTPSPEAAEYMSVKIDSQGYRALAIPPTLTLGPLFAEARARVRGKADAAQRNKHLTGRRKAFLAKRFDYWDEWSRAEHKGVCRLGDYE